MHSAFNALFSKLLVFLIEGTLILLVFEKKSNTYILLNIWKKKEEKYWFFSLQIKKKKTRMKGGRKIHKESKGQFWKIKGEEP